MTAVIAALAFFAFALGMAGCADAARFFGDRRYELYAAVLGALAVAGLGLLLWRMTPA